MIRSGSRRHSRRGMLVVAIAFAGLIMGAAVLVMAISGQASGSRAAESATLQGRYASELAESAIEEALADFPDIMNRHFVGVDLLALFVAQAEGGRIPASVFGPPDGIPYTPERTRSLIRDNRISVSISDVKLRALYYGTVQNYGEMDISASASFSPGGSRQVFRRITSRHYFVLDSDGRTLRVNPVALQRVTDRSRDE